MKMSLASVVAGSLCVLAAGCSSGGGAAPTVAPTTTVDVAAQQAAAQAKLDAAQAKLDGIISKSCTDQVLPRLKSPGSATFMDLQVTTDPKAVDTYKVVGKVRSLNLMGVPLDSGFGCTIVETGGDHATVTLTGPFPL